MPSSSNPKVNVLFFWFIVFSCMINKISSEFEVSGTKLDKLHVIGFLLVKKKEENDDIIYKSMSRKYENFGSCILSIDFQCIRSLEPQLFHM